MIGPKKIRISQKILIRGKRNNNKIYIIVNSKLINYQYVKLFNALNLYLNIINKYHNINLYNKYELTIYYNNVTLI